MDRGRSPRLEWEGKGFGPREAREAGKRKVEDKGGKGVDVMFQCEAGRREA